LSVVRRPVPEMPARVPASPARHEHAAERRRRPSGEPPPLPRALYNTGLYWIGLVCLVVLTWIVLFLVEDSALAMARLDRAVLSGFTSWREPLFTDFFRSIDALGSDWAIRVLRWASFLTLLALRRFRHFFVFLGSVLFVGWVTTMMSLFIARPRPLDVEILGHWEGFAHPSRPIAYLTVTLVGITYSLVVPGRPRVIAKIAAGVIVGLVGLARLYLAVDWPGDVFVGAILGVAVPLVAFRTFCPNEVFPVTYSKGRTAHLDVGGARGEAIRTALAEQLGIACIEIEPFNLEGSAGSTPLRIKAGDVPGEETILFGKLYAQSHLRSDRSYKLGRTLLYGRLEDETSFSTVRRLVQYEDYVLRLMRDAGLDVPEPYGFVEITPEREYLIVTSFFEDAIELGEAEVDDDIIDNGLGLVSIMWETGIAHRDIKPSNLLLKDDRVLLIDVAFAEARPSPWRQAVDLANMMLVLALRTDAKSVYNRALMLFTPDEIAESFAATHGVTMPSQLRRALRDDGRDLLTQFRKLAPTRERISIQRWTIRRVTLLAGVTLASLVGVLLVIVNLQGAGLM
jgi:tRNA A-37 threonylcarbamoyl transferase component Bud32/membrane-associated phospholipid phosphatase